MNPMLVSLVAMLLRQGILMLAGALGLSQIVQPLINQYLSEYNQFLASAAAGIIVVGYAIMKKVFERHKFLMAASIAGKTEHQIETLVKSTLTPNPSVSTPKDQIPQ